MQISQIYPPPLPTQEIVVCFTHPSLTRLNSDIDNRGKIGVGRKYHIPSPLPLRHPSEKRRKFFTLSGPECFSS